MSRLETTPEEVERALDTAIPGWFETSLMKDAQFAHKAALLLAEATVYLQGIEGTENLRKRIGTLLA
jgi:hypothetical protein